MHTTTENNRSANPVEAARVAIRRLFDEGYLDEDMATASLLAVDLGIRRRPRAERPSGQAVFGTDPAVRRHAA